MIKILSVDNMRKSDANTIANGTSGKELMYRAGEGVFKSVEWKAPVAIVCGIGNNAGDGYVIAKLLYERNIPCTLFLLAEKFSEDGRFYYDQCTCLDVPVKLCSETTAFSEYATIVDCIFGTGFRGSVTGLAKTVIEAINQSDAYTVSVDINSGLNGDNGMCETCVVSDITISIGDFKTGHFLNMAKDKMRRKINCDIGIQPVEEPYQLIEEEDLKGVIPERKNFSNKGTYGYIALIGGSKCYSGAIRLAAMANAAMRSGAGVVKLAVPESISLMMIPEILESTLYLMKDVKGNIVFNKNDIDQLMSGVKVIAIGMGIGISPEIDQILQYILEHFSSSLIIDADGLTALSHIDAEVLQKTKARVILTPHVKEFSRLMHCSVDEILENPIGMAKKYAKENNVILLLKGPTTIVTDGKIIKLVDAGCAGMATAGSGDVLSGILAAICGYIPDTLFAATTAAYINGKAGEYAQEAVGSVSMVASDTVTHISDVIKQLIVM